MSKSNVGSRNSSDRRTVYEEYKGEGHDEEGKSNLLDIHRAQSKINSESDHNFKSTIASSYSTDKNFTLKFGESSYYTSSIEEGYANVEEVSENVLQTNVPNENEEEEIFTATPLNSDYFSDRFNANSEEFVLPHTSFDTKSESVTTLTSPDNVFTLSTSNSDSDSDSEISFKLYSDTSSDEEYSFGISPKSLGIKILEDRGNLPDFTKLGQVDKEKDLFKAPINPLVSKRTPTATSTYSSESVSDRDQPSRELDIESDSSVRDTGFREKKTAVKTSGRKTATFCSTNIQSALLSKITPDRKIPQSSPLDNLLKMQLPRRIVQAESPTEKPSSHSEHDKDIIEVDLENFESEVGKAYKDSVNEGSVMPLLKQELQCKIQVRRLSMGQSELVLEPEEPKVYEVSKNTYH